MSRCHSAEPARERITIRRSKLLARISRVGAILLPLALSPSTAPAQSPAQADADAPATARTQISPSLRFGGKLEIEHTFARDLDLDRSQDDRESLLEPELTLALSYEPRSDLQAYLSVELDKTFALDEPQSQRRRAGLEVEQAYLWVKRLLGTDASLRAGRQRFRDEREWLYDEELDALRLYYTRAKWMFELSASREDLVDADVLRNRQSAELNNYFAYGSYAVTPEWDLAAYLFSRESRSGSRENPVFVGLRSHGEISKRLDHWLEVAQVRGRDGENKLRGWAFDAGVIHELEFALRPALTLAYALGSGDRDQGDDTEREFRQIGLQENEARFNGVVRFKYYGELLDPELSNLEIATVGAGLRPTRGSSIDLVYHRFRQREPANRLRESDLEATPSGLSRRLGSEIDLVVGYRPSDEFRATFVVAYFDPGRAFARTADDALFTRVELRWDF